MKVTIKQTKAIRESLGLTHLVIFGIDADGVQHVATHGQTRPNAREAAQAGNALKQHLGWPKEDCRAYPLERICGNCAFYKPDWGIHCFNGWSDDGSRGHCQYEPTDTATGKDDTCHGFEPK